MKPFVHPQALCESPHVGSGTRIWAFAHVLRGARIGKDCNICDGVFIEEDVVVGDRVTVKCGVQLWNGVRLEDDVFVGPNATFTNDPFPRSKRRMARPAATLVRAGASIGANATILPGLTIGTRAMIGAGAVVTSSVPPHAIVVGNPARITGYAAAADAEPGRRKLEDAAAAGPVPVRGVSLRRLTKAVDLRGSLAAGELDEALPFPARRFFLVFGVPSAKTRGEHAHKTCHQFLIAAAGSLAVVVDDGKNRCEIPLTSPEIGVHVPPMVWATQYKYSPDAVLLAFASHRYDAADYIRDYDEFKAALARRRKL